MAMNLHFLLLEDALKFQKFIDVLPLAVFIKDAESKILAMNKACELQWGLCFEDLYGTDARQYFPADQMKIFLAKDREVFANGSQIDFEETVWNTSLKENRIVHTFKKPFCDGSGKPLYLVGMSIDITERKKAEQRIIEIATHDLLTGLPNRILLNDRIELALEHARRNQHKAAVLFIDLDNFKVINDSMGHNVDDLLLQKVAERFEAAVRSEDTVARHGGDEFIVLLSSLSCAQDAQKVAQKIRDALLLPFYINGLKLRLSCSIGISLFPDDGEEVLGLLKNSDAAMYCAKSRGGNNWQFFKSHMNKPTN